MIPAVLSGVLLAFIYEFGAFFFIYKDDSTDLLTASLENPRTGTAPVAPVASPAVKRGSQQASAKAGDESNKAGTDTGAARKHINVVISIPFAVPAVVLYILTFITECDTLDCSLLQLAGIALFYQADAIGGLLRRAWRSITIPSRIEIDVQEQGGAEASTTNSVSNAKTQGGTAAPEDITAVVSASESRASAKDTAAASHTVTVSNDKKNDEALPARVSDQDVSSPSKTHQRQSSSEIVFSNVVRGGPEDRMFASSDDLSAKIHDKYVDVD